MCHFKARVPLLKTLFFFLDQSRGKKKTKPVENTGGTAQVWKPGLTLTCALQGSDHLCASVSPTTPLPLFLSFRMAASLPCQDLARPSQCPAGTCTSTNLGAHRTPSPLCPLTPAAQMPPNASPLSWTLLGRSLKPFPGQERSHPDHSSTEGSAGDQTLPWLRSKLAGAALRAGAASPSTQPPPLLLPSEAPPGFHVSGKIQKWNLKPLVW